MKKSFLLVILLITAFFTSNAQPATPIGNSNSAVRILGKLYVTKDLEVGETGVTSSGKLILKEVAVAASGDYSLLARSNTSLETQKVDISSLVDHNWFNIKQHGADTTGATDVSSLVQSGIDAGFKVIYAPTGKYWINNTIQMKDSVTIIGDGRSATIFKLTSNIIAFKAGYVKGGHKTEYRNFSFEGTRFTSGNDSTQRGIFIDSVAGCMVNDIGAVGMGWVITFKHTGYCCAAYTFTAPMGNQVSGCYIQGCHGGILADSIAEYIGITGNTVTACSFGTRLMGGNMKVVANNFSDNTVGIYIGATPNDGHGLVADNIVNHCTTNLFIDGITRGMDIDNNMFLVGSLSINNSAYLRFNGGLYIADGGVIFNNNTHCTFTNFSAFQNTVYTWTITGSAPTIIQANDGGLLVSNIQTRTSPTDLVVMVDSTTGQIYRKSISGGDFIQNQYSALQSGAALWVNRGKFEDSLNAFAIRMRGTGSKSLGMYNSTNQTLVALSTTGFGGTSSILNLLNTTSPNTAISLTSSDGKISGNVLRISGITNLDPSTGLPAYVELRYPYHSSTLLNLPVSDSNRTMVVRVGGRSADSTGNVDLAGLITFTETDPLSVHLTGDQTINGYKTFTSLVDAPAFYATSGGVTMAQLGVGTYGAYEDGNLILKSANSSYFSYLFPPAALTGPSTIQMPNHATGTLATLDDLTSGYQTTLSGTGLLSFSGTTPSYNTTSSSIASIISDETGSGVMVFGTSPTFTTKITSPLVLGSTATNGTLVLQGNSASSGNTSTNANTSFLVGNSGATTAMTLMNSGNVCIGTTTDDGYRLNLVGTLRNTSAAYLATGGTQSVVIGSTIANASAQLDMESTTAGFLMPRLTSAQRDAISLPATGLQVFNTTRNTPQFYTGTSWSNVGRTTLATFSTDASNSGSTETDLYSYSMPASTLENNGDRVIADYSGISAAAATYKVYVGGTQVYTFSMANALTTASNAWRATVTIIRLSSTTVRVTVDGYSDQGGGWVYTEVTGLTLTSGSTIIKLTGKNDAGSGTGITAKMGTIDFKPVN